MTALAVEETGRMIDSDTVRLRFPEIEEDLNFVRSVYMRSYWDDGLERAGHHSEILREAIFNILQGEMPNRYLRKLAERLRPAIVPLLRLPQACRVSRTLFDDNQNAVRDRLLETSEIWLACSPVDSWFLMGFAIVVRVPSGIVLHYLYVKKKFRRMGLGHKLLDAVAGQSRYVVATHLTHDWCRWVPSLVAGGYRIEYNPYLLDNGDST